MLADDGLLAVLVEERDLALEDDEGVVLEGVRVDGVSPPSALT